MAYWNHDRECIDAAELKSLQSAGLTRTIGHAFKTPLYRRRLEKAGITRPDAVTGIDDLRRLPFTTKDDLREAYPRGLLAVPLRDVIRLHTSSGTTGTPTVIYHTRNDIADWTNLLARCITATGATAADVFQNMTTYGLFTGGLGLHYGAETVGMLVIPASSGNTLRQLKLMEDFGTTVIHATPSYMLHLYSAFEAEKIDRSRLALKKGFFGAEPYSENTRKKIEELWGIEAYNSYGLSEMNGPGVAFECVHKNGMHVWEDSFLMEIVDPITLEPLPDGSEGELVFTTLNREATPLIRYRTRDLTAIYPDRCPCGRTHRRIGRIKGRTDDMLIINGVNVFPSQVETVLMKFPEAGTNYQIVISKQGALDKLVVQAEINARLFRGEMADLDALRERIAAALSASIIIHPAVELREPGSLPVSEGKAKRVVDTRPGM